MPASTSKNRPMIYLHLCCEGWQRFGPSRWLSLQDRDGVIVDQDGTVIARRHPEGWWTTPSSFEGYQWRNPTIAIGLRHPHSYCSEHPRYGKETGPLIHE